MFFPSGLTMEVNWKLWYPLRIKNLQNMENDPFLRKERTENITS